MLGLFCHPLGLGCSLLISLQIDNRLPLGVRMAESDRAASERLAALMAKSTVGSIALTDRPPARPIATQTTATPVPVESAPAADDADDRLEADLPAKPRSASATTGQTGGPAVPEAVAGLSLRETPQPSEPRTPATPRSASTRQAGSGGAYSSATRQLLSTPLAGPVTLGRFLAGFAVMVVLLGIGFLMSGPGEPSTAAAVTPTASHTFQGVAMPVSDEAGPAQFDDATASGFAHTDAGAAMAGLHLTVRSDARTGPTVFEPLLQQQVTGDPGAIKAMVENRRTEYTKWAQFKGVTDNGPVILPGAFSFVGWKIADWSTSGPVTVHLLVEDPKTLTLYDVAPVVEWDGAANDYKLVATPNFGYPKQATVQPSDRSTYTLFATQ